VIQGWTPISVQNSQFVVPQKYHSLVIKHRINCLQLISQKRILRGHAKLKFNRIIPVTLIRIKHHAPTEVILDCYKWNINSLLRQTNSGSNFWTTPPTQMPPILAIFIHRPLKYNKVYIYNNHKLAPVTLVNGHFISVSHVWIKRSNQGFSIQRYFPLADSLFYYHSADSKNQKETKGLYTASHFQRNSRIVSLSTIIVPLFWIKTVHM